jgi:hypothetical protein
VRFAPRALGPLAGRSAGTLRVEHDGESLIASGDLYSQDREPDPNAGIPVFARAAYHSYLRVTHVGGEGPTLGFEVFGFDHSTRTWAEEGVALTGHLDRVPAPEGYPSRDDFLRGEVRDAAGRPIGELTVGWISGHLRRAVVELDRATASEAPVANIRGLSWRELFATVGWDVTVEVSDSDVAEPSGESWSNAELHAEMLCRRGGSDLDGEWRYWLVSVRRLDDDERGLMFDRDAADSNKVPREAAGIASHWHIPDDDPWGLVKGRRFGSEPDLYFRTAVHEIGHAMGLFHNDRDDGIMCPTETVAAHAHPPKHFPENIEWSFETKDGRRLRHLPDHWVRPGGVPYGSGFGAAPGLPDPSDAEASWLELTVLPLLPAVPIGAPVRVDVVLRNAGREPVPAPVDLSLKAGSVRGTVTGPSGVTRSFRPLVRHTEPRALEELAYGQQRTCSLTLLRGSEGALFPEAGDHAVEVQMEWESDGVVLRLTGSGVVAIAPAVDEAHAEAARRILDAPDSLLTLVLGGDHLPSGVGAIRAALANDVLRPHFAFVEARRIATPFQQRSADIAGAAELIDGDTVMSATEVGKAARLVEAAAGRGESLPERLVSELRGRARGLGSESVEQALHRL